MTTVSDYYQLECEIVRLKEELKHQVYRYDTKTLECLRLKEYKDKVESIAKDDKFWHKAYEYYNLKEKLEKIDKQCLLKMNSTPTNFEESAVKVFAHYIYELSTGKTLSEQLKDDRFKKVSVSRKGHQNPKERSEK